MEVPLPWERLLWSGRPSRFLPHLYARGERYALTDMRIVRFSADCAEEMATCDIGDVHRTQSPSNASWASRPSKSGPGTEVTRDRV